MFTVTLMFGYPGPGDNESERVHVRLLKVQFQPVPLMAVAVAPAGSVDVTVTAPVDGIFPELEMKTKKVPPIWPWKNGVVELTCVRKSIRGAAVSVKSVNELFTGFTSPPPETVTVPLTGDGALRATLTVRITTG
jgi:hypothetical protein